MNLKFYSKFNSKSRSKFTSKFDSKINSKFYYKFNSKFNLKFNSKFNSKFKVRNAYKVSLTQPTWGTLCYTTGFYRHIHIIQSIKVFFLSPFSINAFMIRKLFSCRRGINGISLIILMFSCYPLKFATKAIRWPYYVVVN